jgi:hypothetical protein
MLTIVGSARTVYHTYGYVIKAPLERERGVGKHMERTTYIGVPWLGTCWRRNSLDNTIGDTTTVSCVVEVVRVSTSVAI